MEPLSVLITSVGATGAQNVIKALRKQTQYKVRIIGCDATELNAGKHLVDKFYTTPSGTESSYIPSLLDICKKEKVDLFIPIMEAELEAVSSNIQLFAACNPSVADHKTIVSCNDKIECQKLVSGLGIKCPEVYAKTDNIKYPVIIKQKNGTGSAGIKIIRDKNELPKEINKEYIIQEYIEGKEYTVDCFATKDFNFIECVPRVRLAVKGGLSTKTATVRHEKLINHCKNIIRSLKIKGPSNIQFIEQSNGGLWFIEVNPRFGGAYIASIEAGLNAPLFLLNEVKGDPIKYNGYKELTMLRYWQEVYENGNMV